MVTGGAGFLGTNLCSFLLSATDYNVLCVDNFLTGSRENIKHMLPDPRFEVLRHDVTFPLYAEVDEIYNLACPASPKWYQKDPVQTVKTSVMGAVNLLGLAKRTGARILQASTSEVYGDPTVHPQPESYWGNVNPVGPRACYDEGKRCAETLFTEYRAQHGVDARIARIFNTYGPFMAADDGRVVSNFVLQALRKEPITIFGDGSQTRSFCHVSDLVYALFLLMRAETHVDGPFNLGNPHEEVTVAELADRVTALSGSGCERVFRDLPKDDPVVRKPDITRAREVLGWKPITGLDDGLETVFRHFDPDWRPKR